MVSSSRSEDATPTNHSVREHLRDGQVIPAHPLALTAQRTLDERRQRGLTEYYFQSGAGGIAGRLCTRRQFAIRDSTVGLLKPVLELAMDEVRSQLASAPRPFAMIAGVCGHAAQARGEAELAAELGYDAGELLSFGAWVIVESGRRNARPLPNDRRGDSAVRLLLLQPAVGGRVLSYRFWREFAEIPNVWAVKIAPFNRYHTIDVVRAIAVEAGNAMTSLTLYTGNDDNIVADLLTPYPVSVGGSTVVRWIDGGLLGQWAVWTRAAVSMFAVRSSWLASRA